MSIRSPIITDFDSHRVLFHQVVEALNLLPSLDAWDLSWGEPFLALSPDRKLWVRVFYEESLPITIERLRTEADRLKPHLLGGGQLVLCIPEIWSKGVSRRALQTDVSAKIWSYTQLPEGGVVMRELPNSEHAENTPQEQPASQPAGEKEEKLTSDEIRELTEMGVELKRYTLKKAG